MQKSETAKILGLLKAAYPAYYKSQDSVDGNMLLDLWTYQFQEHDLKSVFQALNAAIASKTDGFPPSIGEVKAHLSEITTPERMTADEAWTVIMKAVRRGSVHAQEDWAAMPAEVQRCITPDKIRSMATDENFNESVEMALFFRSWNVRAEQRRVHNAVPPPVREAMELARARMLAQIEAEPAAQIKTVEPVKETDIRQTVDVSDSIHELIEKKRRELGARDGVEDERQ